MTTDPTQGKPITGNAGVQADLRLSVRLVSLIAAIMCLLPVNRNYVLIAVVPALSPYVVICSLLSLKSFNPAMLPGIVIGILAFFKHRLFCRWICPMGTCLDCADYIGKKLNRKSCRPIHLGRWLMLITLGAAILGLPLFLWLDPLSLFAGIFMLVDNEFSIYISASVAVMILLFILSIIKPGIWCREICPLGALQDMFAIIKRSIMNHKSEAHTDKTESHSHPVARRTVIGLMAGIVTAGILRITKGRSSGCLRPPGAVDESKFRLLCTRCGSCIRACPHNIITRNVETHSLDNILTPVLDFEKDYCRQDCNICTYICPSGAISPVTIDQKKDIRIGLPKVDMNICFLGEDRECSACRRFCPYGAIRYVFSEDTYSLAPVIDPEKCNGCGACRIACPTSPQKAIKICPLDNTES